jgi:4a-hydroxytetrahydrobiopterin dehydratase
MSLEEKRCVPCQGGIPPMGKEEAERRMADIPGWELIEDDRKLSRTFRFSNFVEAQEFARRVGEVSEAENHHPVISYSWGWCTVIFFTHEIGGLHENDFIMAAKVNALGA